MIDIDAENIVALVDTQQTYLKQLKQIILQEKDALKIQNAELLLSLANEKSTCLNAIIENDRMLGQHPDKAQLTEETELAYKVSTITDTLLECKNLNAQNASLIEMNLASLNRFAQALQASRNGNSLTYDNKGNTSTLASLGNELEA